MIDSKSIAFLMRGGSNPLQGKDGRWRGSRWHRAQGTLPEPFEKQNEELVIPPIPGYNRSRACRSWDESALKRLEAVTTEQD